MEKEREVIFFMMFGMIRKKKKTKQKSSLVFGIEIQGKRNIRFLFVNLLHYL